MSWVRIDDRAPEHRKLLAAGPVACWLWVCGLAYANRQAARDGYIPVAALPVLYPIPSVAKYAEKLVASGLWERVDGGYQIHDYHDFQPTQAEAEAISARRRAAGRLGGLRSGDSRRSTDGANPKQIASGERSKAEAACFDTVEAKPNPDPDPDPDPKSLSLTRESSEAHPKQIASGKRRRARRPETPPPPVDAPDLAQWCAKWGIPDPKHDVQAAKFLDHARTHGRLCADWAAAWRNWMRSPLYEGNGARPSLVRADAESEQSPSRVKLVSLAAAQGKAGSNGK